jgi:hyperosmotically inducible periplasmic protein
MKSSRFPLVACATVVLLCSAATLPSSFAIAQTAPDNSGQNKNQTGTADNQSNAKSDRLTTANVRKAIIADKDLSTYGHNVKIITVNGAVTLKGPVKSEEEKQKIASDASSVVSANKITNALTVKQ